ncbi:hemopexin repeat-containing protein [Streptomyces sp. BI20]|uniref:hemopexin repeat-containing protein n=1 Tax=Streptomyces sp. BI20 TaxID=3403460 RepID=UPI003C7330C4
MSGKFDVGAASGQWLERWRAGWTGADSAVGTAGAGRRRKTPPVRLLSGVWAHAAARAEQGLELTAWEKSILAPLQDVLGVEHVAAMGRVYREERAKGAIPSLPEVLASRPLDQGFDLPEYHKALGELLPVILAQPNVSIQDVSALVSGKVVDPPEFTAALAEYGFGVTGFSGPDTTPEEASRTTFGVRPTGSYRTRMEWVEFECIEAVGDQGGGKDEIYWTAASNAHGYHHTTRTRETGSVKSGHVYPIHGDQETGSMAFFDATLNEENGCLSFLITLWEADDSGAEWYTELGKALNQIVDTMQLSADFAGLFPGTDLYGAIYEGLSFLAEIWEHLRNKDDLVLSRGIALSLGDLSLLEYSWNGKMTVDFDATSSGMGHFSLTTQKTGDSIPVFDGGRPVEPNWPGLRGTDFVADLDAACNVPGSPDDVYLFKGDRYLRYNTADEKIVSGPRPIAAGWPGLQGTDFTGRIGAAYTVPGSASDLYLFSGTQYVRYNVKREKIAFGPDSLSSAWPGLNELTYLFGLSAACPVPGHPTDVYLFQGSYYVRYNAVDNHPVGPVKTIADNWSDTNGTAFTLGVDAACAVPHSSTEVYLFTGPAYMKHKI